MLHVAIVCGHIYTINAHVISNDAKLAIPRTKAVASKARESLCYILIIKAIHFIKKKYWVHMQSTYCLF